MGGWVLFLKDSSNWGTARMSVCWTSGLPSYHCRAIRQHNVQSGCPAKVQGVTYAAARRRYGFLYFSCQGMKKMMKKKKFYWSHYYPGPWAKTTTTTTTTTTPVPITI